MIHSALTVNHTEGTIKSLEGTATGLPQYFCDITLRHPLSPKVVSTSMDVFTSRVDQDDQPLKNKLMRVICV